MAYDPGLAAAIDELAGDWHLTKRDMFGGLAYFTPGENMCFAIMGEVLLFRVGAAQTAAYRTDPSIREAKMGTRVMKNWLLAGGENVADDMKLRRLLTASHEFVLALPSKRDQPS